jgi:hypothetical protein
MRRSLRRTVLAAAGTMALGAGLLAGTAAPAQAASTCSGGLLGNWQITGGYIAVYYNSSTGYNCAMTYTNKPGHPQQIMVGISAGNGADHRQDGTFSYYAGPVSVYGKGQCINFEGQVNGGPVDGVVNAYCD